MDFESEIKYLNLNLMAFIDIWLLIPDRGWGSLLDPVFVIVVWGKGNP